MKHKAMEVVGQLLAEAAGMPKGMNSTIGAAIVSHASDLLDLPCLSLDWQVLLIDYEMEQVTNNHSYRPLSLTLPLFAWDSLLEISSQAETPEKRLRLLSAVVLFAGPDLQAAALGQLRSMDCESILHFAHVFNNCPGASALMVLGRSIINKYMVKVSSGTFIYGNTARAQAEELRRAYPVIGEDALDMSYWLREEFGQHELYTTSYCISRHPVTNRMFKQFRPEHSFEYYLADHPVVGIDLKTTLEYASWCCCDLPTEVEWEKAIRGDDGRSYAWGNDPDLSRCNVLQSGVGSTTPVGYYDNYSPFGCLDGNGNVWEWTKSDFANRSWRKVIRGGSWVCTIEFARCATRCWTAPTDRSVALGFRVVKRDMAI